MISVIMPAYNASQFIAEAIESILNQTFKEFELIIIDDGSQDNTLEIIQRYCQQDSRVKLVKGAHAGASCARNLGMEQATGEWLAFLDADDVAVPERFEKQMQAAQAQPNVIGWGSYAHHLSPQGKILSLVKQGVTTEAEFNQNRAAGHVPFVIHPSLTVKREIILKTGGFDSRFDPAEDFELFDRMANFGPILTIPEPLLLYRVHPQSATMRKFFVQKHWTRYVVTRHRDRLAGKPELTPEEFTTACKAQPLHRQMGSRLRTMGQFWYRRAGLSLAGGQYLQAGMYLGLATVTYPTYAVPRVWQQQVTPRLNKTLKPS